MRIFGLLFNLLLLLIVCAVSADVRPTNDRVAVSSQQNHLRRSLRCDTSIIDSLDGLRKESHGCSVAIENGRDILASINNFLGFLGELNDGLSDVAGTIGNFQAVLEKLEFFISKIPKIGKYAKTAIDKLGEVEEKLDNAAENIEKVLEDVGDKLELVDVELIKLEEHAASVSRKAKLSINALKKLESCDECALANIGQKFKVPVDAAAAGYSICNRLDAISLPTFPDNLSLEPVRKIIRAIDKLLNEFERVANAAKAGAEYGLCCDNVGKVVNAGLTVVTDLVDTALCAEAAFDPLEPIMNELANLLDKVLNAGIEVLNDEIKQLPLRIEIPEMIIPSSIVDETKCLLSEDQDEGADSLTINLANVLQIPKVRFGGKQGLVDFGAEIYESCKEAFNDLLDNSDWQCCSAASTCDLADQLVLYEGNDCTQDICGTLSMNLDTRINFARHDHRSKCVANDEARSMLIKGPIVAGTAIALGDNSENFCSDDNARIFISKTIPEGTSICVPTFEIARRTKHYNVFVNKVNGLDGKVSRARVIRNVGESDVSTQTGTSCRNWNGGLFGHLCGTDSECLSNVCARGRCQDGKTGDLCGHDGDCKNSRCVKDRCRAGVTNDPCEQDSDCQNSRCVKDICRAGNRNDVCEVDSDCNSNVCARGKCQDGKPGDLCGHDGDCKNSLCVKDKCRAGVTNDPCEKDSDCLNSRCVKDICRAGNRNDPCERDSDCSSNFCARGKCQNGLTGDVCGSDNDCKNRRCVKDICRAGVTNDPCEQDSDCSNRRCVKDICRAGNRNDPCERDSDCSSNFCARGKCQNGATGDRCGSDNDCKNRRCVKDICRAGNTRDPCEKDSDCRNSRCVKDVCRAGNKDDPCEKSSDCNSNKCSGGFLGINKKCK